MSLRTRWAAAIEPTNTWLEYPRPQMVRPTWENLNGLWEYAITPEDASAPEHYAGHILVPYPIESSLSGVKKSLQPDQLLWYRRRIHVAACPASERLLLHFGAVDYEATVYVNDRQVGTHKGGYQNFSVDISDAVNVGANDIVVKVRDPTEQGPNPHGKQNLHAQWMFYTSSSGIWQTVWLERVPSTHIARLKLTPDVNRSELRVEVDVTGEQQGYSVEAVAMSGEQVVARRVVQGCTPLTLDRPRLWSPDDPYLYDLHVRLLKGSQVVDEVTSYFGLRKIEVKQDAKGRARIYLNNRYTYNFCAVDQGYWPDGLYTAPSDAALQFDVQAVKALGFNTVRKHIKIEPQRWYYHCDKLGLMVWQDMPSSNNDTPQARAQFEEELKNNVTQLHNHPSITMWVLFNEGWGAYDQERLADWLRHADPSRLVNGHSGPYDQVQEAVSRRRTEASFLLQPLGHLGPSIDNLQAVQYRTAADWMAGDIADIHFYPGPRMFPARVGQALVTGEYGSFGVHIEGHVWDELNQLGRGVGGSGMTPQQMLAAYASSIEQLKALEAQGLSGSAYFQMFDVENEQQGFITYDRARAKVSVAEIARLNAEIVPRAKNYDEATKGFFTESADRTPEAERYANLRSEFHSGCRDQPFLRRLALMALRQGSPALAAAALEEFAARAPRPYDRETWQSIVAMTYSCRDKGFEVLRTRSEEANALLGAQTAEKKILDVLRRELIMPYYTDRQRRMEWRDFETFAADQFGVLGREAVAGARMMEYLLGEDWAAFGQCYVRYFETAIPRSPYCLHGLSYRVLEHVDDRQAVETAIRVMSWQIDAKREWPVFGRYDPAELDTYAHLLHKCGQTTEALKWQEQAVAFSHGRDAGIVAARDRMRAVAVL